MARGADEDLKSMRAPEPQSSFLGIMDFAMPGCLDSVFADMGLQKPAEQKVEVEPKPVASAPAAKVSEPAAVTKVPEQPKIAQSPSPKKSESASVIAKASPKKEIASAVKTEKKLESAVVTQQAPTIEQKKAEEEKAVIRAEPIVVEEEKKAIPALPTTEVKEPAKQQQRAKTGDTIG